MNWWTILDCSFLILLQTIFQCHGVWLQRVSTTNLTVADFQHHIWQCFAMKMVSDFEMFESKSPFLNQVCPELVAFAAIVSCFHHLTNTMNWLQFLATVWPLTWFTRVLASISVCLQVVIIWGSHFDPVLLRKELSHTRNQTLIFFPRLFCHYNNLYVINI